MSPVRSDAAFTHVALRVRDVDRTVSFYERHTLLRLAHQREDAGVRVAWLAEAPEDPAFVIVAMELPAEPAPRPGPVDHLGFAVASREEVDRIAAEAQREGNLVLSARDLGPIVGYICEIADPDGNVCEFSFGQSIRPQTLRA